MMIAIMHHGKKALQSSTIYDSYIDLRGFKKSLEEGVFILFFHDNLYQQKPVQLSKRSNHQYLPVFLFYSSIKDSSSSGSDSIISLWDIVLNINVSLVILLVYSEVFFFFPFFSFCHCF